MIRSYIINLLTSLIVAVAILVLVTFLSDSLSFHDSRGISQRIEYPNPHSGFSYNTDSNLGFYWNEILYSKNFQIKLRQHSNLDNIEKFKIRFKETSDDGFLLSINQYVYSEYFDDSEKLELLDLLEVTKSIVDDELSKRSININYSGDPYYQTWYNSSFPELFIPLLMLASISIVPATLSTYLTFRRIKKEQDDEVNEI